ncbi:MAG TPA: hypothetical protein VEC37_08340 [Bacillota bacterium]|nr:hypothetical protein [Bacillota bacterium]
MKITKNIQGWLIVIAFLATVAILFGGQSINEKMRVENPLKQRMKTIKEVKSFTVEPAGDGLKVKLQLKQSRNLQMVLNRVKQEVEFYHKKPVTNFGIGDQPNSQLEQLKYQLSFYLEEALASGHFIELKSALDSYNKNRGINAKVYLDNDFIYLQLEEGNNYLYQVMPRPVRPLAVNTNSPEGGSIQ